MDNKEIDIVFYGAAGTVTGSKILLSFRGKKILIDCGLFQGLKHLRDKNWQDLPINAFEIDEVILTHAHLDHSGYLPRLVKQGFKGPIHATPPTIELAQIILLDSAKIQEEEAADANERGYSKHTKALPLYDIEDAEEVAPLFVAHEYSEMVIINEDFKFQFHHSGHILGGAIVEIFAGSKTIVITGDVGQEKPLLLEPPKVLQKGNIVLMESTYGDRLHFDENPKELIRDAIYKTYEKGGNLFIPTFAVERAQEILYLLAQLMREKNMPNMPIYLDSPMAVKATHVFFDFPDWHILSKNEVDQMRKEVILVSDYKESQRLVADDTPKIVLAGSGMITGGRILHYLERHIRDSKNTILLAGFQAVGTRGHSLATGAQEVKFFGEWHTIKAEVVQMHSLSAHGDQNDLLNWLSNFKEGPEKVLLYHGELNAAHQLELKIWDTLNLDVETALPVVHYKF
ncbi:MAG: MBL fold metallo-hydrolase [Chitinophagales bacterium]